MNDNNQESDRRGNERTLNLDGILTTQPELGPSIPDGGSGWIVFIGTLFFQALIPCLIVNFGIFLAFAKLENLTSEDKNIMLWDEKVLYVPLFFSIARTCFDSSTRTLAYKTTEPRLIAVVGTCLTCAGLLFMWMGMTGKNDHWLFVPAGLFSGLGTSLLMVQCEILLAQYFRLKLPILNRISQFVVALGFLVAPVTLGHYILWTSLTKVLLWYQAIILQGLVVGLVFRKPYYLKSKRPKPYQFVLTNPDDEEDIFSKNSRELQIKRQTSTDSHMSNIEIHEPQPSTSRINDGRDDKKQQWESFDEEDEDDIKYAKLNNWEVFEHDDNEKQDWERFEDDSTPSPRIVNELSFAEETKNQETNRNSVPSPLFSDLPVNNNNTYSYDDEIITRTNNTNVFMPNNTNDDNFKSRLDLLKEPTFYKTLLMVITNTYSTFVFYALFPSYLYIEADSVDIRHMTGLMGAFALVNLLFVAVSYWINIDKKKRAICYWVFYWAGSFGYFMISDFTSEYVLLMGAFLIVLSIWVLDSTSKPLLGITVKGETSNEYSLLTTLRGLALFLFVFMDGSLKTCFRLVAIMHFFSGTLWLANFAYKKLRIW